MSQSPLHNLHVQLGAKMVDFAGWQMPLMYRSIIEEHHHTRNACSLFDVSHMGRLKLTGARTEEFLQRICTRNVGGMPPGLSRYSHICREDGAILDDVIVSRFEESFGVVCNAANSAKIVTWLNRHAGDFGVPIEDQTASTAMIALQGPAAMERVGKLLSVELGDLKRYHFKRHVLMTFPCFLYRSGYTGEDGVEIVCPANLVKLGMSALMGLGEASDQVIQPAGLGARDTLRLEAGMPLYGHELTENWDSLTAGQGWCVDLEKDFLGADAMRKIKSNGLTRRIVGLELEGRRTARQGFSVNIGGKAVGQVTSGALSPTLDKSIAMALIDAGQADVGNAVTVSIGQKEIGATVVKLPFYKRPQPKQEGN